MAGAEARNTGRMWHLRQRPPGRQGVEAGGGRRAASARRKASCPARPWTGPVVVTHVEDPDAARWFGLVWQVAASLGPHQASRAGRDAAPRAGEALPPALQLPPRHLLLCVVPSGAPRIPRTVLGSLGRPVRLEPGSCPLGAYKVGGPDETIPGSDRCVRGPTRRQVLAWALGVGGGISQIRPPAAEELKHQIPMKRRTRGDDSNNCSFRLPPESYVPGAGLVCKWGL